MYIEEKSNETNTRQLIGYDNNAKKIIYVQQSIYEAKNKDKI